MGAQLDFFAVDGHDFATVEEFDRPAVWRELALTWPSSAARQFRPARSFRAEDIAAAI